jgi:hypothetical protein
MDKQWEYEVAAINDYSNEREVKHWLNSCGLDGWELITIKSNQFYFKREKKSDLTPIRVPSSVFKDMFEDEGVLIKEPNE